MSMLNVNRFSKEMSLDLSGVEILSNNSGKIFCLEFIVHLTTVMYIRFFFFSICFTNCSSIICQVIRSYLLLSAILT